MKPRVGSIVALVSSMVLVATFISLGREHGFLLTIRRAKGIATVDETPWILRKGLTNSSSSLLPVSPMMSTLTEGLSLSSARSPGPSQTGNAMHSSSARLMPDITKSQEGNQPEWLQLKKRASVETQALPGQPGSSSGSRSLLVEAIRETTRLLYENSPDLDRWLEAPPPKVYVYDTALPESWTNVSLISECIEEKFLGYTRSNQPNGSWGNCFWEPRVCDDMKKPRGSQKLKTFMNYRANYNNDVAYQQWFQDYEFRTDNASEADFFVVPYPHWSHCICHKNLKVYDTRCTYGYKAIERNVISKLEYYPARKEQHLFLYGVDDEMVSPNVRVRLASSMSISLGATCANRTSQLCGHFVTPYLDTSSVYQPDVLQSLPLTWWTERNRTFSVGAAFSTPRNFGARVEFMKNQSIHLGDEVGGLPIRTIDLLKARRLLLQSSIRAVYNESIFCPILPGDNCPQKRFFDVILNGCIPVVPSFNPSDEEGYPTFYGEGSCSIRRTYPWSRGIFYGDDRAGIDYQSLVVQYDGSCGMPCMKPALEKVMRNSTELKRLRKNLQEFTRLVAFGVGDSKYKRVDAFTAMLIAIRHYLSRL